MWCCVSTGIHEGLTFGRGELDDMGFWSIPCFDCAREWEKNHPEEGRCWPFEKDDCTVCHGEKGGVKGNENVIDGKVVCDYCSTEAQKALDEKNLAEGKFAVQQAYRFMKHIHEGAFKLNKESMMMQVLNNLYHACLKLKIKI